MPLPMVVDSLDTVPQERRDLYVQNDKDQKFYLDAEGAGELVGLRKNRDAILTEKKTSDNLIKRAKEAGIKLDDDEALERVRKLLADAETSEHKKLKDTGDFDALKKQLIEQHEKEKGNLLTRQEKLEKFIQTQVAENVAIKALDELEGSTTLLLPHVMKHVRVVEDEDGTFNAIVVDGKGNPRIKDASGAAMGIKDLVAEMKGTKEFAPAFKGTGASGSGASGTSITTKSGGAGSQQFQSLPPAERLKMARQQGASK